MNKSKPTLLAVTAQLLSARDRRLSLKQVAKDTGLTFGFVHHVSVGSSVDPGVNKIQTLYEYLAGKSLDY